MFADLSSYFFDALKVVKSQQTNESQQNSKILQLSSFSKGKMDPDFERRLNRPNTGRVRTLPNGMLASPLSSPIKSTSSPVSSVSHFWLEFQVQI